MCRDKLDTGRRCPCDTSEARRLRRHNAQARAANPIEAPVVTPDLDINLIVSLDEETSVSTEPDYSVGGEKIQQVHDTVAGLTALRDLYNTSVRDVEGREFTLPNGYTGKFERFDVYIYNEHGELVNHGNRDILLPYMEQATIMAGSQIQEIVEARSGVFDADVVAQDLAHHGDLVEKLEEAKKEAEALKLEVYGKYGGHTGYSKALWGDHGEELQAQAKEDGKKKTAAENKVTEIAVKLAVSTAESSAEVEKQMAKQRAVLVETLKEIRSIGGEAKVADNSHKKVMKGFEEAISVYPTAWIEESNNRKLPRVKFTKSRAHYTEAGWQRKAKIVKSRSATLKPEGWEPDPTDRYDLGEWIRMDEHGAWTDPETGMRYEHYTEPGKVAWMRPRLEFASKWSLRADGTPPGRGWNKAEIKVTKYNHELGRSEETGETETVWYRQSTRRMTIESAIQPEITISGDTPQAQKRVALHEFAHRIEASGETGAHIKRMEEQFLVRRTTDPETGEREKLSAIYRGRKEYGRADNFVNMYMGKTYTDGSREVLSTGAEAVFHGSFGNLIGTGQQKADPEMKKFIIGLWATA